jgi:hypothetical protein
MLYCLPDRPLILLVVDSHSETAPSLRIDKPFPELLEHSLSLDFAAMDPTDHGHVPYVYILVRAMHDWKAAVSSSPVNHCWCGGYGGRDAVISSLAFVHAF